jgi:hypothetical protein
LKALLLAQSTEGDDQTRHRKRSERPRRVRLKRFRLRFRRRAGPK